MTRSVLLLTSVLFCTTACTEYEYISDVEEDVPFDPCGAPPKVEIDTPAPGQTWPIGTDLLLEGFVEDDIDNPDDLVLSWASTVDGLLSTDPAQPSGVTTHPWPIELRTEGVQDITLRATDSCGQTGAVTVPVCQDAGYTSGELSLDSWHFEGNARWDGANDWLELTTAGTNQVGTAFQTGYPVSGDAVQIRFRFYIGEGTGADGISLTALDADRMTTFLGGTGCGIGYGGDASCTGGPALPGWSIEVDTYYNAGQDPTEDDHLMLTFDGDVDDPAIWTPLPEMEDTGWHEMVVDVNAPRIAVRIDGVTYIDAEVDGHYDFPAYVGFTAGTGGATNVHLIDQLEVTETICP